MEQQAAGVPVHDAFIDLFGRSLAAVEKRLGIAAGAGTMDVLFLAYLEAVSRFGYFTLGPITIDVALIEDRVRRTAPRDLQPPSEDFIRFSRLLLEEARRSGRHRIDELQYLYAFMRCGVGLPAQVFGELGVTPADVEQALKQAGQAGAAALPQWLTPEEVAGYLKVHVQTVRGWIRSGQLPARRIVGQRALRINAADVLPLLQPLDATAEESAPAAEP